MDIALAHYTELITLLLCYKNTHRRNRSYISTGHVVSKLPHAQKRTISDWLFHARMLRVAISHRLDNYIALTYMRPEIRQQITSIRRAHETRVGNVIHERIELHGSERWPLFTRKIDRSNLYESKRQICPTSVQYNHLNVTL